jgi:hypothetical protein
MLRVITDRKPQAIMTKLHSKLVSQFADKISKVVVAMIFIAEPEIVTVSPDQVNLHFLVFKRNNCVVPFDFLGVLK